MASKRHLIFNSPSQPNKYQQHSHESDSQSDSHSHSDCDLMKQQPPTIPIKSQNNPVSKHHAKQTEAVSKIDKKMKKVVDTGSKSIVDQKPPIFTRVFSEADELVMLQAILDFKSKNGAHPSSDFVAESVRDLLSSTVSKRQVSDKISKLKTRFFKRLDKGPNNHQSKENWFRLSLKIWGGEEVVDKTEVHMENCWSLYPYLCASFESEVGKHFTKPVLRPKEYVEEVVARIGPENARKLEHKWKCLRDMEFNAYAKRAKLMFKQSKAVMDVLQP